MINLGVDSRDCNQRKDILEDTGEDGVPDAKEYNVRILLKILPNPVLLGHDLVRANTPVLTVSVK